MKKVGVILARFQPIHNGHLELIKKASSENDEVLVFIGSVEDGVSATRVRILLSQLDEDNYECFERDLQKLVPPCVFEQRYQIKAYLDVWNR